MFMFMLYNIYVSYHIMLCFITCYVVILYNMLCLLCYITCYVYVMFYKHVMLC